MTLFQDSKNDLLSYRLITAIFFTLLISFNAFADGSAEEKVDRVGTYYEILGVTQNASEGEIKKAFRALCRQYHPQYGHIDGQNIRNIILAYSCLKDSEKRAAYDQKLGQAPESPRPWATSEAEFSSMWYMSMAGTGHKFSAQFDDFTLDEVFERSGKYERFVAWMSKYVTAQMLIPKGNPYWIYNANSFEVRWDVLASTGLLAKGLYAITAVGPWLVQDDKVTQAWLMWPVVYAFFEMTVWNARRGNYVNSNLLSEEIAKSITDMAKNPKGLEQIKAAILTYDIVELLAFTSLRRLDGSEYLFHHNMQKIGKEFPLFKKGQLLRSFYSNGIPFAKKPLISEIHANPEEWDTQMKDLEAEAAGVLEPTDIEEIRSALKLKDENLLLRSVKKVGARLNQKARRICEQVLILTKLH